MALRADETCSSALTAAQRARSERNRLRARALHDARLERRSAQAVASAAAAAANVTTGLMDSGGGFLIESAAAAAECVRPVERRPAPLPHVSQQPDCIECGQRFPHSYLFDTFEYSVCDACRDPDGAHALVTRTEAKNEYLLKDCDLDARSPPLRALVRRNPHAGAHGDMRLYVRAAVEQRARDVWGGEAELQEERKRRLRRREEARAAAASRRLRALRMDVRSSLYSRERTAHAHRWAPECPTGEPDEFQRTCLDCGHTETFEKM